MFNFMASGELPAYTSINGVLVLVAALIEIYDITVLRVGYCQKI